MQSNGISWMLLAGALLLAPAVTTAEEKRIESVEQFSTKLLAAAEERVGRIVGLMHLSLNGDAQAQFELGALIYQEGPVYIRKNVNPDDPKAFEAALKEVDAAALKWLLRSARQGHLPAILRIPDLFRKVGRGHRGCPTTGNRYLVQAYAWDRVLFRMTGKEQVEYHSDIKYLRREHLESNLTGDQVAEAVELSREIERAIKETSK